VYDAGDPRELIIQPGKIQCLSRTINGQNLLEISLRCQTQCDAPTPGPDVRYDSCAHPSEQQFDQPFGFGTRNQGSPVAPKRKMTEARATGNMTQRLAGGAALNGVLKLGRSLHLHF
jgi:hypothetical protein